MASQINSLTTVYSIVYSEADQRKHQSSASLAVVWGIHRWPAQMASNVEKIFPFDDVNMNSPERQDETLGYLPPNKHGGGG